MNPFSSPVLCMVKEYFGVHKNMDQNQHCQPTQQAHDKNQYQSNPMMAPTNPPSETIGPYVTSSFPREKQHAPQDIYQEQLNNFWAKQCQEIEETTDLRTHSLPYARIKKIMKADRDVRMVSAEAPVLFAKACEMFIMELTMKAWANAEDHRRRILQKSDIASAISKTDVFDFLEDIVPRDVGIPRSSIAQNFDLSMPPHQNVTYPPYYVPAMVTGRPIPDQNHHGP